MTGRLYHCNSEIRAHLNYLIKIYLYTILTSSFKRPRSLKAAGLVSFDCAKSGAQMAPPGDMTSMHQ